VLFAVGVFVRGGFLFACVGLLPACCCWSWAKSLQNRHYNRVVFQSPCVSGLLGRFRRYLVLLFCGVVPLFKNDAQICVLRRFLFRLAQWSGRLLGADFVPSNPCGFPVTLPGGWLCFICACFAVALRGQPFSGSTVRPYGLAGAVGFRFGRPPPYVRATYCRHSITIVYSFFFFLSGGTFYTPPMFQQGSIFLFFGAVWGVVKTRKGHKYRMKIEARQGFSYKNWYFVLKKVFVCE